MVCMRFSASIEYDRAGDSKTSSVTSSASIPNFSWISRADLRFGVVKRGQAVHELDVGIAGQPPCARG